MYSLPSDPKHVEVYNNWIKVAGSKGHQGILDAALCALADNEMNDSIRNIAGRKFMEHVPKLTRLWWTITGRSKEYDAYMNLFFFIAGGRFTSKETKPEINSAKSAFTVFMLEFEDIFHTKPKLMTTSEKKLMEEISNRIWNSPEVQQSGIPPYEVYKQLMAKYYSGSHFHFEEKPNEKPILDVLKEKVGYKDDKKDLGKDQLAARVSSHFVKFIGEQNHVHLAGEQIPETVMSEVTLCEDPTSGELITGVREDMVTKEQKLNKTAKKFFWIQTENNPDGPDWTSFLKHRLLDFPIYFFRKKMGYADVNVGPFGYGRGDRDPIVIHYRRNP